jgi:class 3 adenylate cyclase
MPNVARLQRRRFDESEEVRVAGRGKVEIVELGDRVIARLVWEPGWRWSVDVKPIAGTQWCQSHHVGYAISGRLRVQMSDGVELELGPGEVFEIPPGHDAWVLGDEPYVTIDFEAMRGFARPQSESGRRTLASILMTDIVDSTAQAVAQGADAWRDTVSRHNEIAERVIVRHDGRLVKTTGDGVIGLFDSSERAIRAAVAIADSVRELDLRIRAAVHTGEVELSTGDVRGVAVHAAARMMALGGPDEVVVSSTVHDVVDGTGLEFDDFGVHELKGLPGRRQLYRLRKVDRPELPGYLASGGWRG